MLGRTSGHYLKSVGAVPGAGEGNTKRNLESGTTAARLYHTILPYITP